MALNSGQTACSSCGIVGDKIFGKIFMIAWWADCDKGIAYCGDCRVKLVGDISRWDMFKYRMQALWWILNKGITIRFFPFRVERNY